MKKYLKVTKTFLTKIPLTSETSNTVGTILNTIAFKKKAIPLKLHEVVEIFYFEHL